MQGAPVVVHLDPVLGKPLERLRIDAVFLRVDTALEIVERLAAMAGTAACMITSPWSMISSTRCTVQP